MADISRNLRDGVYRNFADAKARTALAREFSASTAYAVGEYVLYEGTLYKFTTAHSAGAWNASQATQVTIGGDLKSHTHAYLPTSGGTMTGTITAKTGNGTSWIAGTGGTQAGIYVKKGSLNANQWIPGLTVQTKSGGGWAIGNYDNENLVFAYGTKANIDAGNNTTNNYTIDTSGNYSGKASNVTGTVAIANGGTGATTAANARTNLGITPANIGAAASSHSHAYLPTAGGKLSGTLHITGNAGNYNEGIRIHMYNSWCTIELCGADNTGDSGTSANSWGIFNNNGNFHISRNGSSSSGSAILSCVNNVWSWNGTATGNISGQAGTLKGFENNNSSGKNANNVTYNGITYYTSNGPATSLGATVNDGALYCQAYSANWVGQIAQDYRNGNLFTRGKNNGTWQAWQAVQYRAGVSTTDLTAGTSALANNAVYYVYV